MKQLSFFDAEHEADLDAKRGLARRTDPDTSHEAAAKLKTDTLRSIFLERLKKLGEATANEVAQGDESVRKRCKELLDDGLIIVVGKRRCRVTNNTARTFRVNEGARR